jgi:ACS family hexuronate transporter-like MFS transporter
MSVQSPPAPSPAVAAAATAHVAKVGYYRWYVCGLLFFASVINYIDRQVIGIGGGWLSSTLIKRAWTVNAARKTAMLVCALAVRPIIFAANTTNLWVAVGLIGLAAAAHQGWSANVYTLTSDMFPKQAIGSVVGFGGTAGAIGGMLIAKVTAAVLQYTGSYLPVFIIAASAYLVALLMVHLLSPRLEPAPIK